jgi:hypothetical protein
MASFDLFVTVKLRQNFDDLDQAVAWLRRASLDDLGAAGAEIVELQVLDPTGTESSWRRLRGE